MTRRRTVAAVAAALLAFGGVWVWTEPNAASFRELDRIGLQRDMSIVAEDPGASRLICIDICNGTTRIYRARTPLLETKAVVTERLARAGYTVLAEPVSVIEGGVRAGGKQVDLEAEGRQNLSIGIESKGTETVVYAFVRP